jgi:6-phosphogluconolactonase
METRIMNDVESVARESASRVASAARSAIAARGLFTIALSGGTAPALWLMLQYLARVRMPWEQVHIFQVDERVAPVGHPERNLTSIHANLPQDAQNATLYPMPVNDQDLPDAAKRYGLQICDVTGSPAILDFVHLGIGPDGHTASLVPGDPVLDVTDRDVAISGPYENRLRMTLTYPILNRARQIMWLATGAEKAGILRRFRDGDPTIPASHVEGSRALLLCDALAAG